MYLFIFIKYILFIIYNNIILYMKIIYIIFKWVNNQTFHFWTAAIKKCAKKNSQEAMQYHGVEISPEGWKQFYVNTSNI